MKRTLKYSLIGIGTIYILYLLLFKNDTVRSVIAEGECLTSIKSDRLSIIFSVSNKEKDSRLASEKTKKTVITLTENIKSLKLEDLKIETQNYVLQEERHWDEKKQQSVLAGFESVMTIRVETSTFDRAGEIIDAVSLFSDGRIDSLNSFVSEDVRQKTYYACLSEAGEKAKKTAEKMVVGIGAHLGKPITVQEVSSEHHTQPMMRSFNAEAKMDSSLPVFSEEEKISVRVQVNFELR